MELGRRQNNVQSERRKELGQENMNTTKVSVFCVKFLQSFENHIPIPHPSKDSLLELWKHGREWVEAIIGDNGRATKDWVEETELLSTVGVHRLLGGTGLGDTIELHLFCDPSLKATAVAAYIKTTSNQGTTIRFIMRKARVAPLPQTTIPRLELQAALYAARLKKTIEDEMDFKFDKIFLWSDSTTVLNWIKNFKLKHKMYIENRIAEIRDLTSTNQWNNVNTEDNPADRRTRRSKVTEITEKSLWLQGPRFLRSSNDNCTTDEQKHENGFMNSAEQKSQATRQQPIDRDFIDAKRFSQWLKLRAVIIKI